MFEQQMIERSALDLKGGGLAREAAVAKNQLEGFAGVSQMKLRPLLCREASRLQRRQHTHLFKNHMIVRQQRFANVKPGKMFLLKDEGALARSRQKRGCGAAAGPAADDDGVKVFGSLRGVHLNCLRSSRFTWTSRCP